jgi:Bifunctional DNA primase/polymerase, N-terminal
MYRTIKNEAAFGSMNRGPKEMLFPLRGESSIETVAEQEQFQLGVLYERLRYFADRDPAVYANVRIEICELLGLGARCWAWHDEQYPGCFEAHLKGYLPRSEGGFPILAMAEESPQQTLACLYDLLSQAVLLPIPLGKKGPNTAGWQNTAFADTQTREYREELLQAIARGGNIGVLLGPASGGLIAIDLDDDEIAEHFLERNPQLGLTLRRANVVVCTNNQGRGDSLLEHLSPIGWEHIHLTGDPSSFAGPIFP